MKNNKIIMNKILLISIFSLFIFSCKKNKTSTEPATSADVTIQYNNNISGMPIVEGKYDYTNAAGNIYNVLLMKYYVTNVVLMTDYNVEVKLNNYDLIDAFNPQEFSTVQAKNIPNGTYKTMKFYLGIDSSHNHTGAQTGALDPSNGMIWDWNTGYLFFKHEGKFISTLGDTTQLSYHLGTDKALSTIYLPIDLVVNGVNKTMNIDFDLNKMYANPVVDFNNNNFHHSTEVGDRAWINSMIINAQNAFSFKSSN